MEEKRKEPSSGQSEIRLRRISENSADSSQSRCATVQTVRLPAERIGSAAGGTDSGIRDQPTLERLWREYSGSAAADDSRRRGELREKLVLIYLPLVKWTAGRLKQTLPQSVPVEDLESAGVRGLIQSVEAFDPQRGIRFESYASTRIRGAMLDGLRELDWLPRSLRGKVKSLERAMESCGARLGGIPEDEDVAQEMGLTVDDYRDLLEEVGSIQMVSLDTEPAAAEGEGNFHDVIPDTQIEDPLAKMEREEQRQQVLEWLQDLPEQMRRVMVLYYYEELTLKEIGQVLDLSESRVCQIHSAAIHSLRARLQQELVA